MQDVNIRFKDFPPEVTVARIKGILEDLGIRLTEYWNDSGIENCWSLRVNSDTLFPCGSNGKGVSKELARASAYGEFIERIQCGMLLYKYQSITRDPRLNLQSYSPDGKYMSVQELIQDGEWMDYIIKTHGGGLTRAKIAEHCRIYGCADDGMVWTIPFYSLFDEKTVYLPAGFVEHIYSANGCCAGNTREEAWIHALSEIMERNNTISILTGKKSAPIIPDEVIRQYPTAYRILEAIRATGNFDVQILDFSQGSGYPVVATRLIEKNAHSYSINIASDPVFEIAIDRTLTESFQGRKLKGFILKHAGGILEENPGIPTAHNVLNQIENGSGLFALKFFTDNSVSELSFPEFANAHEKDNIQLLDDVLNFYKKLGHPVFVRNYSFLGFNSYQFVVPGISETRGKKLLEPISEFALGDAVYKVFRDVESASAEDLLLMLSFYQKVGTAFSRINNFSGLAGLPMSGKSDALLTNVTLAHAAWKLGKFTLAINYLKKLDQLSSLDPDTREYLKCVSRYISLLNAQAPDDAIKTVLYQFFPAQYADRLYAQVNNGKSPFECYLLKCNGCNCESCKYSHQCAYTSLVEMFETIGRKYAEFRNTTVF